MRTDPQIADHYFLDFNGRRSERMTKLEAEARAEDYYGIVLHVLEEIPARFRAATLQ